MEHGSLQHILVLALVAQYVVGEVLGTSLDAAEVVAVHQGVGVEEALDVPLLARRDLEKLTERLDLGIRHVAIDVRHLGPERDDANGEADLPQAGVRAVVRRWRGQAQQPGYAEAVHAFHDFFPDLHA